MSRLKFLCGPRVYDESYLDCERPLAHKGDHRHGKIRWPNLASESRKKLELEHAKKYAWLRNGR